MVEIGNDIETEIENGEGESRVGGKVDGQEGDEVALSGVCVV